MKGIKLVNYRDCEAAEISAPALCVPPGPQLRGLVEVRIDQQVSTGQGHSLVVTHTSSLVKKMQLYNNTRIVVI